jgi:predicted transglutaminase-like cysteine proteinase
MRTLSKIGLLHACMLSVAIFATSAIASPKNFTLKANEHAPEFGKTLPPVGFVKFCIENPSECAPTAKTVMEFAPTPEQWTTAFQVNTFVNGQVEPVSDMELYGQAEYWTYPTNAGDCEDYLLLKKRYLESLGFPSSALLITVVLDEKKEGHAVLTVKTTKGDYVLDNRRNDILGWDETGYAFLKRQSQDNPKQWIALASKKNDSPRELASR